MTHNVTLKSGWQILAEIDLTIAAGFESQLQTWIIETMDKLSPAPKLLNRILKSALEAITRAENSNAKEPYLPLVNLRFYVPLGFSSRSDLKRDWGFFRLDKRGAGFADGGHADHLIEFFLYFDN